MIALPRSHLPPLTSLPPPRKPHKQAAALRYIGIFLADHWHAFGSLGGHKILSSKQLLFAVAVPLRFIIIWLLAAKTGTAHFFGR